MTFKTFALITLLIITSGCAYFQSITPKAISKNELPGHYSFAISKKKPGLFLGIQSFDDNELRQLIASAMKNNFTLNSARAQYMQAKASAMILGALTYPRVNASLEPSLSKTRSNLSGTSSWNNQFSLGLMSSFEMDLWGRIRAQKRRAEYQLNAVELDYQAAMISLIAEITLCWVDIISQRIQQDLLQKQLTTNGMYLKLIRLRFQKGMVGSLDVYQQQQVVESIASQLPLIKKQERLRYNQLGLLCGVPRSNLTISRNKFPTIKELPSAGIPSDLLSNRPDIQASWNRLQASYKNVWVSKTQQLPSLTLSATGNFESNKISSLFDAWFVRLAGQFTTPLFDAGRLHAETQLSKAKAQAQLIQYRRIVYNAIREVEDALTQKHYQNLHLKALKQEQQTAQKALDESRNRYQKGLSSYLPVLTHTLSVQRLEREIIQQTAQYVHYHVYLYRALGGQFPLSYLNYSLGEENE